MKRNPKWAARAWWALLPYIGFHCSKEDGSWRWYMRPAYWLWTLVGKLPGSDPFEQPPPIECTCDYCRGVPGAVYEP